MVSMRNKKNYPSVIIKYSLLSTALDHLIQQSTYLDLLLGEFRVLGNIFGGPIIGPFVSFSTVSDPVTQANTAFIRL